MPPSDKISLPGKKKGRLKVKVDNHFQLNNPLN